MEADLSDKEKQGATDQVADQEFDFDGHRKSALDTYKDVRDDYGECAHAGYSVLKTALKEKALTVHSIEWRAKELESFGRKAVAQADDDPMSPKYSDPMAEITDLAGVRVITFLLDAVEEVNAVIEEEFEVLEKSIKSGLLEDEEKLGYQSVHFLVRFSSARCALPEYARFRDKTTEIQVRTILQHAWAEIEHDIQYKAVATIPKSIRRRFTSLAGLVEIADREFQAISDEDARGRSDARKLVAEDELEKVEITEDALKAYLDQKYGPDGRMSDWSYDWTARLLKGFGFKNFEQVDQCISVYDDDKVSRAALGARQGQLYRFELVLLAAMGEEFIRRHPWYLQGEDEGWFADGRRRILSKLEKRGIPLGEYRPE